MADPISDDELQEWKARIAVYHDSGVIDKLTFSSWHIDRLLARLDAAESRAAELQREVERLRYEITERNEMICQGCRGNAMEEQEDGSAICEECGLHSTMNQSIGVDPC